MVNEVKARVSAGYKEVVFTGTKIGDYKHNGADLKHLVEQILANTGCGAAASFLFAASGYLARASQPVARPSLMSSLPSGITKRQ